MQQGRYDWAGAPFLAVGLHDAQMMRGPGLYGLVRRVRADERVLLFIDQADSIALAVQPTHPIWAEARALGMNEIHVCLRARERIDRLILRHHIIRRVEPILNLIGQGAETPADRAVA